MSELRPGQAGAEIEATVEASEAAVSSLVDVSSPAAVEAASEALLAIDHLNLTPGIARLFAERVLSAVSVSASKLEQTHRDRPQAL